MLVDMCWCTVRQTFHAHCTKAEACDRTRMWRTSIGWAVLEEVQE